MPSVLSAKKSTQPQAVAERIDRVAEYIRRHPQNDLSLNALSRLANCSKFHFLRLFNARIGITPNRLAQQTRLKRASFQLVFNPACRITDIALEAGFENIESFSRAFKRAHDQSPLQFRRCPQWLKWYQVHGAPKVTNKSIEEVKKMDVALMEFPETMVAALEHHGPESQTYNTSMKFIEWRKANGIRFDMGQTYGIHYTDPRNTFPEDYRMDICVSVDKPVAANDFGVVTKIIPAGRCAVIRHIGSREWMPEVGYLVYDWLPQSGEQLRDYPVFFHYVNVGPDLRDPEMITDIYLPLQ
jgi:AraC family transcriptional regulator